MKLSPEAGKGWTDEAEAAFREIMAIGGLDRLRAIRLYRRFGCDVKRALKYASEAGEHQVKRTRSVIHARAAKRFKGGTFQAESVGGESLAASSG